MVSDTDATDDLGTTGIRWNKAHIEAIVGQEATNYITFADAATVEIFAASASVARFTGTRLDMRAGIDVTFTGETGNIGTSISSNRPENVWVKDSVFSSGIATANTAVALTADDQVVTTTDISFIVLSSDDAVAANRTFTLTAGADGQQLTLLWSGANAGELLDTGIAILTAAFTPDADDTLTLISNGTNWYEKSRAAN